TEIKVDHDKVDTQTFVVEEVNGREQT
ncbi:hypothetical protein, partial [Shigella sonnei]